MKHLIKCGALLMLTSCTLTFVNTHTEGTASDTVDTTTETQADVSPTLKGSLQ